MPATEQEKADLSKTRGVTAAHIPDAAEKRDYIAAQGKAESKGMDQTKELKQGDFNKRNELAVLGSMKKGGLIKKTGLYKMHKDEIVLPSPAVLTGKAPKTMPGGKKLKVQSLKKNVTFKSKKQDKLGAAMREVHKNVPKSVTKTGKTGAAKEAMIRAIGFSKAGQSKE
jgi:hypothetical protein